MFDPARANCFFRIAWIESGENFRNKYILTLAIKEDQNSCFPSYVSFYFSSFDLLYSNLKNLSDTYKTNTISELFEKDFPAAFEFFYKFNRPNEFYKFYDCNNSVWPFDDIKGFFIIDDFT